MRVFIVGLFLFTASHVLAQSDISGFNPNYLVFGNDSIETNEANCDIKFQLSFSRKLRAPTIIGEFITKFPLYFGYTQESYWDICGSSAPFRENNFRPTLFYPFGEKQNWSFGYVHESNGRDGDESRGWERLVLKYSSSLGSTPSNTVIKTINDTTWMLDGSLWLPFAISSENENITDFAGFGELSLTYTPKEEWRYRVTLRKGGNLLDFDRGLVEIDIITPLPWFEIQGFIQYTNGFGASLDRFDQREQALRVGFLFSDFNLPGG